MVLRAKLLSDPVYLREPVVEGGKVSPWNKQAFRDIYDAIQHAYKFICAGFLCCRGCAHC